MNTYKIVGTNDIQKFVALMNAQGISQEMALMEGIDEDAIHELHEKARTVNLVILVVPSEFSDSWMNTPPEMAQQGGMIVNEKTFIFKSISGSSEIRTGVMVPVELEDKPARENEIGEDDINRLSKLLESDIDFDTFIKSI